LQALEHSMCNRLHRRRLQPLVAGGGGFGIPDQVSQLQAQRFPCAGLLLAAQGHQFILQYPRRPVRLLGGPVAQRGGLPARTFQPLAEPLLGLDEADEVASRP
jgi:hypothetical protein